VFTLPAQMRSPVDKFINVKVFDNGASPDFPDVVLKIENTTGNVYIYNADLVTAYTVAGVNGYIFLDSICFNIS